MPQRLFSVHVAKAGGSSLRTSLQKAYGDEFQAQYDDDPANPVSPRNLDPARSIARLLHPAPGKTCIHGHYHPGRFATTRDDYLFTILREPVENIISIYFFWKQLERQGSLIHHYFLDNDLSIADMARLPIMRTLYSHFYFGGFPMERFDHVADNRYRKAAIKRLGSAIGRPLDLDVRVNVTPPDAQRQRVETDGRLMASLRDILIEDVRFFEKYAEGR